MDWRPPPWPALASHSPLSPSAYPPPPQMKQIDFKQMAPARNEIVSKSSDLIAHHFLNTFEVAPSHLIDQTLLEKPSSWQLRLFNAHMDGRAQCVQSSMCAELGLAYNTFIVQSRRKLVNLAWSREACFPSFLTNQPL